MIALSLKLDDKALAAACRAAPKEARLAAMSAMRRTASSAGTQLKTSMGSVSFLKKGLLAKAIMKPTISGAGGEVSAEIRVVGKRQPYDRFKLVPNRITARKGTQSRRWAEPSFRIGPTEGLRKVSRDRGKGFVIRAGGKKLLLQRIGRHIVRASGITPQYFAAFDSTVRAVSARIEDVFPGRFVHEFSRRLGG